MRTLLIVISIIGLMFTIIPSVLVFTQHISFETHKLYMAIGMFMWFGTAVFWIKEQDKK